MKATLHGRKYRITYRCPGYGKPIRESFDSLEEANLRLAQIEIDRNAGTLRPPDHIPGTDQISEHLRQTITVRELMDKYVALYGLNNWSENTLSCNTHRINDYIKPHLGDVPIKSLTTLGLEHFYQWLMTQPAVVMKGRENEERTISYSVVEKVHAIIRSALNQAIRWDYLRGSNPAMTAQLPKKKKQRRAAWTDAEAKQALTLCEDPALKLCMYLALGCSMRIGEILGLTWDCVQLDQSQIDKGCAYLSVTKELRRATTASVEQLRRQGRDDVYFTFPKVKCGKTTTDLVLKAPKTESSVRDIFLPKTVATALQREKEAQAVIKKQAGDAYMDFNLVVAQPNGRPYEEHMICQKLRRLIQTYDLKPVVFHSLRHSSTSLKLRISGGDIKAVQGDTGHAQANMVTDVYAHIMNDDRRNLAVKMERDFFSPPAASDWVDESRDEPTAEAIQLILDTPGLAETVIQMTKWAQRKNG